MGGPFLGQLPDTFDRVELWRVWGQAKQLDSVPVLGEPQLSFFLEVVAGTVVDDEEDLASASSHDLLEELEERESVEDRREAVMKPGLLFEGDDPEDVRRLAHAERVYTWLAADSGPRLVKRPIEPEAGFVTEGNDATALTRFFLIRGRISRNHVAWRARSARASRLRGRCTEKRS